MKKIILFFLFTNVILAQTPNAVMQDRMNFEPGELIVKLKDEVNTKVYYAKSGKAESGFNIGELLGISNKVKSSTMMFHQKSIEASIANKQKMKAVYAAKAAANPNNGYKPKEPLTMKNIFVVKTKDKQENILQLIEQIKDNPAVEYAEPNYIYSIDDFEVGEMITAEEASKMSTTNSILPIEVNDPLYSSQSNITATNIDDVWDQYTTGDGSQVIAILDTGVDYTHPDLEANIWINEAELNGVEGYDDDGNGYIDDIRGWDFINNDNAPLDDNMHGTHVAGIAGAVGNNGIGIAGAAWNVKLMPIKVFQSSGQGSSTTIAEGVEYASNKGANIINMSFGGFAESFMLKTSLETAYSNSFLVAASGNNGISIQGCPIPNCRPFYPAAYSFVLGIWDTPPPNGYSNYDPDGPYQTDWTGNLLNYELKAPGTGITSTIPNGGYATLTGTSMATPIVAGVLALYNEVHPNDSHELIFGNLINTGFAASPQGKSLNAIDAISVVPIPAVEPLYAVITDTINNQNGNGYWQPGETLNLFPLIKNYWGPTEDVRVGLDFWEFEDTSKATIDINEIQIGSISAYATLQDINQSLQLTINENLVNNVEIRLAIRAWSGPDQEYISEPLEVIINVVNSIVFTDYITEDITLTNDKEWIFANSMVVYDGATVTIESGTTVKIQGESKIVLCPTCKIFSNGTSENPVTITSETGYWYGIEIESNSTMPYGSNTVEEFFNSSYFERGIFDFTNFTNFGAEWSSFGVFFEGPMLFRNCNFSNFNMGYNGGDKFSRNVGFYQCNITEGTFSNYNLIFLCGDCGTSSSGSITGNFFSRTNFTNNDIFLNVQEQTGGGFRVPLNDDYLNYTPPFYNGWTETNWFSNIHVTNSVGGIHAPNIIGTVNPDSGIGIWDITDSYWFGTSTIDFLSTKFYDYSNNNFFVGLIDYSNARLTPFENNHGVVSKVEVNSFDAQDEYALLDPLGVGNHEFKVYFNREMDTSVNPQVSYGVTIPYNQNIITEEGTWSEDGKIYTVIHDVNIGAADGINRIRLQDAQDLDYFKIPVEDSRFNFLLQSAGSASAGFLAQGGLGKIDLEWTAPSADELNDVLGYNMYRYQVDADGIESDPVKLNETLIVEDTDESTTGVYFTDYEVVEDQTYFYKYKILRTSFEETDYSNAVSTAPLTSTLGDSNGDFEVNVLDLVQNVDYIVGNNPEPFIFVAGDVNADEIINILDIVGTVDIIINGDTSSSSSSSSSSNEINFYPSNPVGDANFTWEGNDLYVESNFDIGGIQLAFNTDFDYILSEELPSIERLDYTQEDSKILMLYSFNNTVIASSKTKILTRLDASQEFDIEQAVVGTTSGANLNAVLNSGVLSTIDAPFQNKNLQFLNLYPNPAEGLVHLEYYLPNQMDQVVAKVYDLLGRLVHIQVLENKEGISKTPMELSRLKTGNYIVLITANTGGSIKNIANKKLIIE